MLQRAIDLIKDAAQTFVAGNAPTYAAAIAFFTVFSLAPLVAIVVVVAGFFVGRAAAEGELTAVLSAFLGPDTATFISNTITRVVEESSNATFTLVSIIALVVGASAVFSQLKMALDAIWDEQPTSKSLTAGVLDTLRRRALALLMILVAGAALLFSVLFDFILVQIGQLLEIWFPGISAVQPYLTWIVTPIIAFLAFVIMFKLLPETSPAWRETLVGAALTTVLFTVGTLLIGFFLNRSGTGSLYGAAGSLIVILLWVYYSSWIILFGAAFTRVYGESHDTSNGPPAIR